MQAAEGLIFLIYSPWLAIELDFEDIIRVGPMIKLVLNHARTDDLQSKRNFEENASLAWIVFGTSFHVINEDLCWEEDVAELTLHRNSVLEDPLVDLDRADF